MHTLPTTPSGHLLTSCPPSPEKPHCFFSTMCTVCILSLVPHLTTWMLRAFLQKCFTSAVGMLHPGLPASDSSAVRCASTAATSASARSRYSRCSCRYSLRDTRGGFLGVRRGQNIMAEARGREGGGTWQKGGETGQCTPSACCSCGSRSTDVVVGGRWPPGWCGGERGGRLRSVLQVRPDFAVQVGPELQHRP